MKKIIAILISTLIASSTFCKTIIVTNATNSGVGSFRQAVVDAKANDTITFADELANDTIKFISTVTIQRNITIKGNGITFSGDGKVRILIIFGDATISSVKFIDGYIENDGGAAIYFGGHLNLYSCEFRNNAAKSGAGNGGGAIRSRGSGLNIIHCSFVNNRIIPSGVLEEKKAGGAIRNVENNTVLFGCVFQNNEAINEPTTNDIYGTFTSLGYNVFTTSLAGQIATDKVSLIPSLVFEDGVYKIINEADCPAKGLIPANITVENILLPERDVLNSIINRTFSTHAGSCLSISNNIQVIMTQSTGGTIACDAFTGTEAVFTPSQVPQLTFTQQAAIGYKFEKWIINDMESTDASISLPLKTYSISAVFRFIDTEVTTKVFNVNTQGSLPYIIARCENNAVITFADAMATETISFTSTININDKSLTIIGNGVTLSGNNVTRILYATSAEHTLTLENLRFINGKTSGEFSDGAAIYSYSNVIARKCLFKNNRNTQASCNKSYGGAVRLKNTGYFESCVFDGNLAQAIGKGNGRGAGIFAEGNVSVVNCTFLNNVATAASGINVSSGGAIFAMRELILAGTIFRGNDNTFATEETKVVSGNPLVSKGYNILDRGFLATQWTNTDLLTTDSIISETDYLPVQSDFNPVFGFIPAGVIYSGIVMPTYDFYGNICDYSKAFCAGACQSSTIRISANINNVLSLKLYPNPANEYLFIEGLHEDTFVQIYSINGAIVLEKNLTKEFPVINVSSLNSGIYIFFLKTSQGVFKQQILINP